MNFLKKIFPSFFTTTKKRRTVRKNKKPRFTKRRLMRGG